MDELTYNVVAALVSKDFDTFDFADKPMEKYCAYNRTKHIEMATPLVIQHFSNNQTATITDIEDFIHGLNHLFFNGVAAGQCFEWFKNK